MYRYEALKALYDNEEDLLQQFKKAGEDGKWVYDGYTLTCTFKNNTDYTYSTTYVMKYYDKDKTMYESSEDYIENIKPGTSYVL